MLTDREQFIALVDNDQLASADAIILLEGDGLSRLAYCAELFHKKYAPVICFSGAADNHAYGSFPFSVFKEKLDGFGLRENNFIVEQKSLHTQQQAVEVLSIAVANNWKKIILVASNFHQYRAYLTFLKQLEITSQNLIIINAPVRDLPWFSAEPWGQRFDLLQGEFEKIEKYIELGHCATYDSAITYQKWKEARIIQK